MTQWIKCSERMPLSLADVLLQSRTVGMMVGFLDGDHFITDSKTYPLFVITHWQPLPEPPTN